MAPERFGPYRFEALIGRGGMGEVFRAWDEQRDRLVALKRLQRHLASDMEFRARFQRESALAAKLREPHIIPIHDYGEIDGMLYIDMRLVEGTDLATVLKAGRLSAERSVDVVSQIGEALDAAHAEQLVHRDVKPSNVLLVGPPERAAERGFAYLADFGIVSTLGGSTLSRPGLAVGTTAYMAPERMSGERVDARIDVYSVACMLFECLTGHRPFPASDLLQALRAHLTLPRPRPSEHGAVVPPELDEVVMRGMAKNPNERYATAGDLAAAARAALQHVRSGASAPQPVARLDETAQALPAVAPDADRAAPSRDAADSAPAAAAGPAAVDTPAVSGSPAAAGAPAHPAAAAFATSDTPAPPPASAAPVTDADRASPDCDSAVGASAEGASGGIAALASAESAATLIADTAKPSATGTAAPGSAPPITDTPGGSAEPPTATPGAGTYPGTDAAWPRPGTDPARTPPGAERTGSSGTPSAKGAGSEPATALPRPGTVGNPEGADADRTALQQSGAEAGSQPDAGPSRTPRTADVRTPAQEPVTAKAPPASVSQTAPTTPTSETSRPAGTSPQASRQAADRSPLRGGGPEGHAPVGSAQGRRTPEAPSGRPGPPSFPPVKPRPNEAPTIARPPVHPAPPQARRPAPNAAARADEPVRVLPPIGPPPSSGRPPEARLFAARWPEPPTQPGPADGTELIQAHPAPPRKPDGRGRWILAVAVFGAVLVALALVLPRLVSGSPTFERMATIVVGVGPAGIALAPDGSHAYVTNQGVGTISVIDSVTRRALDAQPQVGPGPAAVVVAPDGRHAYVADTPGATVSVLDTTTYAVAATIPVGRSPVGMAISRDGARLYVANSDDNTVTVIDTAAAKPAGPPIPVSKRPYGVAVSPDGKRLYVTGFESNDVTLIDTASGTAIAKATVGDGPVSLVTSPDGARLYVVNQRSATLSVIDTVAKTSTVEATRIDASPTSVAIDPTGRHLYVTCRDADTVVSIDATTLRAAKPYTVGDAPVSVAVGPRDGLVYVVGHNSTDVTVLQPGAS